MRRAILIAALASAANAVSLWRSLGDWCEKRLITTDYTEQLDFYESMHIDFDRFARDEYLKTASKLFFKFDREKRAYLRALGARLRRRGSYTDALSDYQHLED